MKKLSKILSILLVLTLVIPGLSFAVNDESVYSVESEKNIDEEQKAVLEEAYEKVKPYLEDKKAEIDLEDYFNEDDEVRIIVELSSNPSIVYATENGKKYSEMSQSSINNIERKIENEQQTVKNKIAAQNIKMEYLNSFNSVFNGFSGKVKFSEIPLIERISGVKKVYIANEYERPIAEPNMNSSNDMIGSKPTWDIGYKGEGMVVAVIDTGIDPNHKDMVLSEGTTPKLTESSLEGKGLPGKYFTEKVPYGYNYYDLNNEILDLGPGASEHGMHVAGTVGANGNPETNGVKGVAPECQLLAMKVFSNDPIYATTFSDIYIAAIDDAIKIGIDALNMSLGSTAAFYIPEDAANVAITNAVENGIVCAVSAGNSGQITYGWVDTNYGYPWKQNPDIGLVGSPGLSKDTIQVASIENTHMMAPYLSYEVTDGIKKVVMSVASSVEPAEVLKGKVEFVDCGIGAEEDFEDKDMGGKVALIIRGGLTFVEKIMNAQNAGAAGVIIYNHASGGEELINMAYPPEGKIPAVFIGNKGGLALLALESKFVQFSSDVMQVPNPKAETMSDFTSWGTTPSLDLKPEITAPGGQIYSTLQNNKYGMMSGTSMASPHVAGGSALVMQYIKAHPIYKTYTPEQQARLAKVLLMNTADVVLDPDGDDGEPISPRRQGAGLMNLYGAVSTPVRVVNKATGEAKVELKDFEDTKFEITLKAINDSDKDIVYNLNADVLTDYIYPLDANTEINLLGARRLEADIDYPENGTITVPANGSKEFTIKVDFAKDKDKYRNMFVEGFVTLTEATDTHPTLSVPYVGFYGKWDEPKILDGMRFIDPKGESYFGASGMIYFDAEDEGYFYNEVIMSPGTEDGEYFGTDNVIPYLSFMRNAEKVKYNILDKDGNLLRTIYSEDYVSKNYINGGTRNPSRLVFNALWDGKVNGKVVPDGEYFYEIAAKVHYKDAQWQSKKIPVLVDATPPEISEVKYNPETGKLTWSAKDTGSGLLGFWVEINEKGLNDVIFAEEGKQNYEYDLKGYFEQDGNYKISLVALDKAMNLNVGTVDVVTDEVVPYIYLIQPELLNVYDTSEITFKGYVVKNNDLSCIKVNGEEAEFEFNDEIEIIDPEDPSKTLYRGPGYTFEKTLMLEDGVHEVSVEAITSLEKSLEVLPANSVIVEGNAYNIKYLNSNAEAQTHLIATFNSKKPIYIKLAQGTIVDIKGVIAENDLLPKTVVYFDAQGNTSERGITEGAKGSNGTTSSIVRRFYVDTTDPELEINIKDRASDSATAELEINMKDNFPYFKLYLGDSEVYTYDGMTREIVLPKGNETTTITVNLKEGENTFVFTLVDIAGHKVEKTITINRETAVPGEEKPVDIIEIQPIVEKQELK